MVRTFSDLIGRIATQGDRWQVLEHFKSCFAAAVGVSATCSTTESWAETDLGTYLGQAAENAPLCIEAFLDGCRTLGAQNPSIAVPDVALINQALARHETGYPVRPPDLITTLEHGPIGTPEPAVSLDEQVRSTIRASLNQAEQFLMEGRSRQAVSEVLWLLESVTTVFKGTELSGGAIQGKYFNRIIDDLRRANRGRSLDQILGWIASMHGYLSSPTGGGIRHGVDLRDGAVLSDAEARLMCNLVWSYISFLLAEYAQLKKGSYTQP